MASVPRIVFIGGGPRATGILERLVASRHELDDGPLEILIIDPAQPGAGVVWGADQSPLLLMNSAAGDVTVFTDESSLIEGPITSGPDLVQWSTAVRAGRIPGIQIDDPGLARELAELGPQSFASRRLQNRYLDWFFRRTLARSGEDVRVEVVPETVTAVVRDGDGYRLTLSGGDVLDADVVLLATGHTDEDPTDREQAIADAAARNGLTYHRPAYTGTHDWSDLAPGQDVLVSGMGLSFVDLFVLLGEGRGGRFEERPDGTLTYLPSGREPRLHVGSRRGVPHRSKVMVPTVAPGAVPVAGLTTDHVDALLERGGPLNLRRDIWPLLAADLDLAWYRELAAIRPEALTVPWTALEAELRARVDDPAGRAEAIARVVPAAEDRLDLERLQSPLSAAVLTDDVDIEAAVRADIAGDLAGSGDPRQSPRQALFLALLRAFGVLGAGIPSRAWDEESYRLVHTEWQAFFSYVCSGPPPHRLRELLALHDAGVVRFLGPDLQVRLDEDLGAFVASASGLPEDVVTSAWVEARQPVPSLDRSASPMLRQLGESGLGGGEGASGAARLRTDDDHRVICPEGRRRPRLYAVGPVTTEVLVGAFARPRTNSLTFRANDQVGRSILYDIAAVRAAGRGVGRPAPGVRRRRPHVGIVGPGRMGSAIARAALDAGLGVRMAGRSPLDVIADRISHSAPGASACLLEELVPWADVIVLAVPVNQVPSLPTDLLAGAVVLDATNPWGSRDEELLAPLGGRSSALTAQCLRGARIVKTLNHVSYHDLEDDRRAAEHPQRRALVVASDTDAGAEAAAELLDLIGYDAVRSGVLATGEVVEPGRDLFTEKLGAADLRARLEALGLAPELLDPAQARRRLDHARVG